jgi:Chaperone of endosialidase
MKSLRCLVTLVSPIMLLACLFVSVLAQSDDKKIANVTSGGSSVRFDVVEKYSEATLTVTGPDGYSLRKVYRSGAASPEVSLTDSKGERLADGVYIYELRLAPNVDAAVKEKLAAARKNGNEDEVQRDMRKRGELPQGSVQSGSFTVLNGSAITAGASEGGERQAVNAPAPAKVNSARPGRLRPAGLTGLRHHVSLINPFFDFVIADDLIVQGSACVGLDCVDGEVFGFDTIRMKENNTRLQYDDTSTSAGFATNNWQIRANSSASGGGSFLAFVDQGATGNSESGTIVFEVDAGAPANSLRVSSGGNVGIGTATPVLDLHANTTDTPAIRLEQNNSGGFTAQTWDIGANEANFFVRDVTGGSRLSLRIRPGAPTSSLDIAASGDVGLGTASPVFSGNTAKFVAMEGGTEFTEVGSGSNQAGTTAVLGTYSFFNSNRTTPEKRNAVITGQNDGATNSGAFLFFTSNAGTLGERMRINSIGRVGIGTASPDQLLSVNGEASKAGGGAWLVFSDERLKTIKGNYTLGLNAVMQLQPIRYEYRKNNGMGVNSVSEHIGFGAQALQKVIPDAVTKNEQGYLLVNNDPIIWTMLNAIKEQQKQIEDLKKEVEQLRAAQKKN